MRNSFAGSAEREPTNRRHVEPASLAPSIRPHDYPSTGGNVIRIVGGLITIIPDSVTG